MGCLGAVTLILTACIVCFVASFFFIPFYYFEEVLNFFHRNFFLVITVIYLPLSIAIFYIVFRWPPRLFISLLRYFHYIDARYLRWAEDVRKPDVEEKRVKKREREKREIEED